MKTESIEEFLARGGKVEKSKSETTLDELLTSEGLLNQKDAEKMTINLKDAFSDSLKKEFKSEE